MEKSAKRFAIGLAGVVLLLCRASIAFADQPEQEQGRPAGDRAEERPEIESADALIAEGIELRRRREDRLALAAFERAWELSHSPRALAQRALAEQALGLWREAFEHLEQALARTDDAWIVAQRPTLEAAKEEIASRLGTVELSCNVDGAEVKVDGRAIGQTPLQMPLRLVAGKSVIQVTADGHFDVARQVQVDAGGISRVSIDLTPISELPSAPLTEAPAAPPLPPSPAVVSAPSQPSIVRVPEPPPSDSAAGPEPARDLLMYSSAGLAALGGVVGVTGYVMREVNMRDYNDDARCARQDGVPRSIECADEHAAWQRGELLATIGASAAGVFGLSALYLWLTRSDTTRAQVSCAAAGAAISCSGSF